MRKLPYIFVFLFYNLTIFYTAVVHDHQFSWKGDESCNAYIISISQHSDPVELDKGNCFSSLDFEIVKNPLLVLNYNFEYITNISSRAPPA